VTGKPCIAALEGPCCAGKTTLARLLLRNLRGLTLALVQCYADHVGGGKFLPPQEAQSVKEREAALSKLLAVEAGRFAALPSGSDLILADRSVHTLLAHSYALEVMTGIRFLAPSAQLLADSPIPAWPDVVVYLDLPQEAVHDRNQGKFGEDSIYIDPVFNSAVRTYFLRLAYRNTPCVMWLDATLEPAELVRVTGARLRQMVARRSSQGAV